VAESTEVATMMFVSFAVYLTSERLDYRCDIVSRIERETDA
jgi:hypothetical protein